MGDACTGMLVARSTARRSSGLPAGIRFERAGARGACRALLCALRPAQDGVRGRELVDVHSATGMRIVSFLRSAIFREV